MKTLSEIFNFKPNEKIFKRVNVEKGSYGIIAYALRDKETLIDYYQEGNENVLKTIQNWKFKKVKGMGKCGYDYSISILKDGDEITKALLCLYCNRIIIENEIYKIEKKKILKLLNKNFLKVRRDTKKFNNREEGRRYFEGELENPLLVNYSKLIPNWINYEGNFEVEIIEDRKGDDFDLTLDDVEKRLKNRLDLRKDKLNYSHSLYMLASNEKKIVISYFVNSDEGFYQKIDNLNKGPFNKFMDFEIELLYKE